MRGQPLVSDTSTDWPRLLDEARDHGLLTLLHESLVASGIAVPEFFHEAAIAQWASAQILAAGLESTLDALKGITVMPLKGPMLAEELYGDPALRRQMISICWSVKRIFSAPYRGCWPMDSMPKKRLTTTTGFSSAATS